jgi:oligopeptide transport system substrate-binding protein
MKLFLAIAVLGVSSVSYAAPKVVSLALLNEPPQLDSTREVDVTSSFIVGHILEGLTRYGEHGEILPGVAEKWEIKPTGAVFHLRKNALWSDGKPVTANDFVFAWRKVVDPANASEYAFIMYAVKNAEAINTKKMPIDQLGVSAPDPYTLKVEFERPCGYFLGLGAFPTYAPIRQDYYESQGQKYAAEYNTQLYNGPFILTKWVHGASLTLEKNPNYWNKDRIKIDKIEIPYITPDFAARVALFKDGKIDYVNYTNGDELRRANAEHFKIKTFLSGRVNFLQFNVRDGRPTKSLALRKAIKAAFNSQELIQRVIGVPGTGIGKSLIPAWLKGVKGKFRQEFPLPDPKPDLTLARKYLEEAKKELGGTIPPLTLLSREEPLPARESEYFQEVFKKELGIDLKIDKQIFKVFLSKQNAGDFDISWAGWSPDFADPMTYAELLASWNENDNGKWVNAQYDELIRKAQSTIDPKVRMESMAKAEKIMLDDVAILPINEESSAYSVSPRLNGLLRSQVGSDPELSFVSVK